MLVKDEKTSTFPIRETNLFDVHEYLLISPHSLTSTGSLVSVQMQQVVGICSIKLEWQHTFKLNWMLIAHIPTSLACCSKRYGKGCWTIFVVLRIVEEMDLLWPLSFKMGCDETTSNVYDEEDRMLLPILKDYHDMPLA